MVLSSRGHAARAGVLAGVLAASGPVVQVWGHGQDARSAALGLAAGALVSGAVLGGAGLRSVPSLLVCSGSLTLPLLASWSTIGRAPGLVAAWSLVLWALAIVPFVGVAGGSRRRLMPLMSFPAALIGLLWAATGSLVAVLGVSVGAIALIVLYLVVPEAVSPYEVPLRAAARRVRIRVLVDDRSTRRSGIAMLVAAAFSAAVMAPLFVRIVRSPSVPIAGVSDFGIHLRLARGIEFWPFELTVPHPVFHALVRGLDPLLGTVASPVVVLTLAVAVTAAAATNLALQDAHGRLGLGPTAAVVFGVGFFLSESPSVLLQQLGWIDPASYVPIHLWGNPTETVAVATTVVLVPLMARFLTEADTPDGPSASVWVTVATVVATLSKPSMTLALIPAAPLFLGLTGSLTRRSLTQVAQWFLLPALAICAWQYWFVRTGQSPEVVTGVTFDPLALIEVYGWTSNGPLFWIAPMVVVLAVAVGRRRFVREPVVLLSLLGLAVSMVPALLLRETGERAFHGNLAKSGYFCWVMLWLLAARFWAFELRDCWTPARSSQIGRGHATDAVRAAAVTVVAVVVLVSGVIAHFGALGALELPAPARSDDVS